MQSKVFSNWLFKVVVILGLFGLLQIITQNRPTQPMRVVLPTVQTSSSSPVRLIIPRIGVDSTVESVGFTTDGSMEAPKGPTTTAWFNRGPIPGEVGSAVIDGHFGWKDGVSAVFDKLSELKSGDKVYVEDASGTRTTFVVRIVRVYEENADASKVFISNDGHAHLNLITCGGVWDKGSKDYSTRTVVFTDAM